MTKDWTGNSKAIYTTLGASNHSDYARAKHDFYATEPDAVSALFSQTDFFKRVNKVWECACGAGHRSKKMEELGLKVYSSDLYDYGYGVSNVDFLQVNSLPEDVDCIVTNPPYKIALSFCEKCVELGVPKFAMFLKLTFLEGKERLKFFDEHPPRYVHIFTNRVVCAMNGDEEMFKRSSAACYAWFVWEKDYQGKPEITWLWKNKNDVRDKI